MKKLLLSLFLLFTAVGGFAQTIQLDRTTGKLYVLSSNGTLVPYLSEPGTRSAIGDSVAILEQGAGVTLTQTGRRIRIDVLGNATTNSITQGSSLVPTAGTIYDYIQPLIQRISNLESALATLTTTVEQHTASIAANLNSIATLESRVNAISGAATLVAPTVTTGTLSASAINITIGASASATAYNVQYTSAADFTAPSSFTTASLTPTISGLTPSTLYRIRVFATAPGLVSSAFSNTVTATTSAPPSAITNITSFPSFQDIVASNNNTRFSTNPVRPVGVNDQAVLSNYYLAPGATGVVAFSTVVGNGGLLGTANMAVDSTTSIYNNGGNFRHTIWLNHNGTIYQVNARTAGTYASGTPPTIAAGASLTERLRVEVDSVFYEYSVNGAAFVRRTAQVRYKGTPYNMYPKFGFFSTNQNYIENIWLSGAWTAVTLTQATLPTPSVTNLTANSFQITTPAVAGTTSYKFDIADDAAFTQNVTFNASNNGSNVLNRNSSSSPPVLSGHTYYVRVKNYTQGMIDSPYGVVTFTTP